MRQRPAGAACAHWTLADRSGSRPLGFFTAEAGRITEPRYAHNQAIEAANLPHVTLHGLRRSFGTLSEWCEVPVGVVAQIQGHKLSALAEKHYSAGRSTCSYAARQD